MEFNINNNVKVKLTDFGRKILQDQHDELYNRIQIKKPEFNPPKEDKDGWSNWQLWVLMERFGEYIHIGVSNAPFETTIIIDDE